MNYKKFKKQPALIRNLLIKLHIVKEVTTYLKINNLPDWEFFAYERGVSADFYFRNFTNFAHQFDTILDADIISSRIYTADCLQTISKETRVPFNYTDDSICHFLLTVHNQDKYVLDDNGFDTEFDEYKLRTLSIFSIDNMQKRLNYEGSFYGSSYEMDSDYWSVYAFTALTVVPLSIYMEWFYKSLVAESYTLFLAGNHKLSFFMLFSALESFVNDAGGTMRLKGELQEKMTFLFKTVLGDLEKHEIYSGLAGEFKLYSNWRNTIAHGNEYLEMTSAQVEDAFVFVLTLMLIYENKFGTFDDICSHLIEVDIE